MRTARTTLHPLLQPRPHRHESSYRRVRPWLHQSLPVVQATFAVRVAQALFVLIMTRIWGTDCRSDFACKNGPPQFAATTQRLRGEFDVRWF